MNTTAARSGSLSDEARAAFLAREGVPFLLGDWLRALFIHYEVEAEALQPQVPFDLDLHDGKAWVSVVAFSMRRLRPRLGGKLAEWLFRPLASCEFLNVRTYVRHGSRVGIYFITEWLNNLPSIWLGPSSYGLPYRFGDINYEHHHKEGKIRGTVQSRSLGGVGLRYAGMLSPEAHFVPCPAGSLEEFLLERYTAFTGRPGAGRFFQIWHKPWPQVAVDLELCDDTLLGQTGNWFKSARRTGANYSAGVTGIWIGPPRRV
jgi:hypothetical protein